MGKNDKPKFMKSKVTTSEESKISPRQPSQYGGLSSGSIQYTDISDDHVLTSDSSGEDSRTQVHGLPLHRAVVVVANAALGAGMLNFPQAYDKSGGLVNALTVQTVSWVWAVEHHSLVGKGWGGV
jgi:hypothetical protein